MYWLAPAREAVAQPKHVRHLDRFNRVGLFHETERYRPKPTETGPKNANNGPNNYIYYCVSNHSPRVALY